MPETEAAPEGLRPLVVQVEWEQDGESRREIYGPWTPVEDDSHLEDIMRFLKGWHDRTGITPASVTLLLCVDPEQWLAGRGALDRQGYGMIKS